MARTGKVFQPQFCRLSALICRVNYSVSLNRMEVFAPVGVTETERAVRTRLLCSVRVGFSGFSGKDELSETADYTLLSAVVRSVSKRDYKLLESMAHDIILALRQEWPHAQSAEVTIEKPLPPVQGLKSDGFEVKMTWP